MESNAQIIKSLGALEEAVKGLATTAARMDDRALAERHAIYERVDELKDEINDATARVEVLATKLELIYPTVVEINKERERSIGAKHYGKLLWGAVVSILTILIAAASQLYQFWEHHQQLPPGH